MLYSDSFQYSFNPRARRGRDSWTLFLASSLACFNPRARRGRDMSKIQAANMVKSFNPRARRGRDYKQPLLPRLLHRFNPRARRGRDYIRKDVLMDYLHVSIHAPAGGATERTAPVAT